MPGFVKKAAHLPVDGVNDGNVGDDRTGRLRCRLAGSDVAHHRDARDYMENCFHRTNPLVRQTFNEDLTDWLDLGARLNIWNSGHSATLCWAPTSLP